MSTAFACWAVGHHPPGLPETWAPEEFTVISGPASPRVALAVRREGRRLALAVEAAALPGGEPRVKLGVAAVTGVTSTPRPKNQPAPSATSPPAFPPASLVANDAEWKRLRIAVATSWIGGPGSQPRLSERFRHLGGAAHGGLANGADAWQPFDLDENAAQVADRTNRIVVAIDQPVDGRASVVIESPSGERLRNLVGGIAVAKGQHHLVWDGCDDAGRPLPPGTYRWGAAHHPGLTPRYLMTFGNGDNTPADFQG